MSYRVVVDSNLTVDAVVKLDWLMFKQCGLFAGLFADLFTRLVVSELLLLLTMQTDGHSHSLEDCLVCWDTVITVEAACVVGGV